MVLVFRYPARHHCTYHTAPTLRESRSGRARRFAPSAFFLCGFGLSRAQNGDRCDGLRAPLSSVARFSREQLSTKFLRSRFDIGRYLLLLFGGCTAGICQNRASEIFRGEKMKAGKYNRAADMLNGALALLLENGAGL